jgi:hypothetical protein
MEPAELDERASWSYLVRRMRGSPAKWTHLLEATLREIGQRGVVRGSVVHVEKDADQVGIEAM